MKDCFNLAADMGGTRIKLGLVDGGTVRVFKIIPALSHEPIGWQMDRLKDELTALCRNEGLDPRAARGIGISFPAIIDRDKNRPVDYYGKYPGSADFDFDRWAEESFSCDCYLENDARCALLGESRYGAGKGIANLAMFTLGTGIGSAVIEKGELLKGERGLSGNLLGHRPDGSGISPCVCGKTGCAEAETSLPVLNRLISDDQAYGSSSLSHFEMVDYRILFECRRKGDGLARKISDYVMDIWSGAMIPALEEFGAEKIILGGGIMGSAETILPYLEKRLRAIKPSAECFIAQCGDKAALLGASELSRRGNKMKFDLYPEIAVKGFDGECYRGYGNMARVINELADKRGAGKTVIAVEFYPGVHKELAGELSAVLGVDHLYDARDIFISDSRYEEIISRDLTDDRVRGVMGNYRLEEFIDADKRAVIKEKIDAISEGIVLICGTGATLAADPHIIIYADLARWEIQKRYRRGEQANLFGSNYNQDFLRMYKRAFFFDWRMADRKKRELFPRIDFFLDANDKDHPLMITGRAAEAALDTVVSRPFRMVPYYDAGPWGGQWMKEKFALDPDVENYAWSFDGVPEENSLIFRFGDEKYEMPAINSVHLRTTELLGAGTEARFGAEFPIRFDMLDTMGGGNLSLQVHPTTEFIRETYGMSYTQDESYYILDADESASVYLGVKEGTELTDLVSALNKSQDSGSDFDAHRYINRFPARKHDHFMIPGGTIHCSGKNTMVLEISATPYIFTFKLWDWNRNGLDGRPRPVHIAEGEQVIDMSRDREKILTEGFINPVEPVASGAGWREERTGLHELEFIETRRHWFTGKVLHDTEGTVNVLNLVEGDEILVESPDGAFEPMTIRYGETFIVPARVGKYTISPVGEPQREFATIKAYVRGTRKGRKENK